MKLLLFLLLPNFTSLSATGNKLSKSFSERFTQLLFLSG
jgi:hypothetical protein